MAVWHDDAAGKKYCDTQYKVIDEFAVFFFPIAEQPEVNQGDCYIEKPKHIGYDKILTKRYAVVPLGGQVLDSLGNIFHISKGHEVNHGPYNQRDSAL